MFKIRTILTSMMLMASTMSFAQDVDLANIPPTYDVPFIDGEQFKCMVLNLYHEARSESNEGMIAVGHVTLNRVRSKNFPNTICNVVRQAVYHKNGVPKKNLCQFSWWCDGKSDKTDEMFNLRAKLLN